MNFLDHILGPPSDDIRRLQEQQRQLDENYRQYKGPDTQQQEDECKKHTS